MDLGALCETVVGKRSLFANDEMFLFCFTVRPGFFGIRVVK